MKRLIAFAVMATLVACGTDHSSERSEGEASEPAVGQALAAEVDATAPECRPDAIKGRLATDAQLKAWVKMLRDQGPRFTGSPAHHAYNEFIKAELAKAGIAFKTHVDHHSTWFADRWQFSTQASAGSSSYVNRPTATYYPYSGKGEVTAPLIEVKKRLFGGYDWTGAEGKIAVVRITSAKTMLSLFMGEPTLYGTGLPLLSAKWLSDYNPAILGVARPIVGVKNPLLPSDPWLRGPSALTLPNLKKLLDEAGSHRPAGVIFATDFPEKLIQDQYSFGKEPAGVPALVLGDQGTPWVDDALGSFLRPAKLARLRLDATTGETDTTSVIATLPGTEPSQKSLVLITHTDGFNEIEENGPLGLISIARAIKGCHRRNVTILFAAGHTDPVVANAGKLLERYPEIYTSCKNIARAADGSWLQNYDGSFVSMDCIRQGVHAVAAVGIEHLGAKHFALDPAKGLVASGKGRDPGLAFTSDQNQNPDDVAAFLVTAFKDSAKGQMDRSFVTSLPFSGIGEALHANLRGLRSFGFAPMPDYLLRVQVAPGTTAPELTDIPAMAREIRVFTTMIMSLQASKFDALGGIIPPNGPLQSPVSTFTENKAITYVDPDGRTRSMLAYVPDAPKPAGVFVWLHGTESRYDDDVSKRILKSMAQKGAIAVSVDYPNSFLDGFSCAEHAEKAKAIFGTSSEGALARIKASIATADFEQGIVVGGWSLGAWVGSLGANPAVAGANAPYLRAGWFMGAGNYTDLPTVELQCIQAAATSLRLKRVINGQDDSVLGGNDPSRRLERNLAGVKSVSGYDSVPPVTSASPVLAAFGPEGQGFQVVRNAESAQPPSEKKAADHFFFNTGKQGGNLQPEVNWDNTNASWGRKANVEWLSSKLGK